MSASSAIGMVGESLIAMLEDEMSLTPGASVTLLAPDENGPSRRINLFLYKVQENSFFKNKDWEVSSSSPSRIVPPPLTINLYYLMTAYAPNDAQNGNANAHLVLGEAMRVLHENPVVPDVFLAPGLSDAREQIKIMQVPPDMDELSKIWSTFSSPYRLSVAYEVAVVQLDQAPTREQDMPTRVTAIGVPEISAPFAMPGIESVSPLSGPVGTVINVSGAHLDGWSAYVDLGNQRIADGQAISGDSFSAAVPAGIAPGFHRLRIDISRLHRSSYFFEVTP